MMTFPVFCAAVFAAVCLIAVCTALCRSRHPWRGAFLSAACGVGAMGAVNLFASYTGVGIAVNWFTAFAAVVLGAPGVVAMLILRVLFLA